LRIVCNTSPLILLAKIQRLDLLIQLYHELIIPKAVLNEISARSSEEANQILTLLKDGKLNLREASKAAVEGLPEDLGPGEREAIGLAIETGADLVILDDQLGRRVSRSKGMPITGTVGVLIEARERGLIHSLRHEMDRLIEAGMWISELFYHRILKEYGE
jgi:predicted nucleic acid-binding protein